MSTRRASSGALLACLLVVTTGLVSPAPAGAVDTASPLVISEVYGGGGNAGASFSNDFIELHNHGADPVRVDGWSVQYASAAGSSWTNLTALSGTIAPGGFYLVGEAAGATPSTALATPDATGSINLSGSSGKVALVHSTAPLGCGNACSATAAAVDFVGYGAATDSAGGAPAAGLTSSTSAQRTTSPYSNSGVNATDFTSAAPTPKAPPATHTAPVDCTAVPVPDECVPGTTTIQDVQGDGFVSPLRGSTVAKVPGVVTAVRLVGAGKGFWLQQPDPDAARASASSGVFVFTAMPGVSVGDSVLVSGSVSDYYPLSSGEALATTSSLSTTEISPTVVTVVSTANPVPAPVLLAADLVPDVFAPTASGGNIEAIDPVNPAASAQEFYEAHEGMLVQVDDARVVGPGQQQYGEIYITTKPTQQATPRGGTYIAGYDAMPSGRLLVAPVNGVVPPANVGDVLIGATSGPIDWSTFGGYDIAATQLGTYVNNGLTGTAAASQAPDQLAIATYNVENLAPSDPQSKYDRLGAGVVTNLAAPDIVTVEEVQDNSGATDDGVVAADATLTKLTQAIAAAGGPRYEWAEIDPVNDADGGQPGGNIRVVFLYNPVRVTFVSRPGGDATTAVTVAGGADTTAELSVSPGRVDPTNQAWTTSRKPLAGEFVFNGAKVIVVANHFNSKGGDQSADGRYQPPTRSSEIQRTQQAAVLEGFVEQVLAADPQANVVLAGDFNDYQFSVPMTTLTNDGATLTDLIDTLPADQRYTYVFNGISQVLDHIFVTPSITDVEYEVIHVNSEFAAQASDHDPQVVRIRPLAPARTGTIVLDPAAIPAGGVVHASLAGWDPATTLTVALDGATMSTVAADDAGAAATDLTVPAGTTVGDHTVTVTSTRGTTATAALTVTPPPVRRGYVLAAPLVRPGAPTAVILYRWSPATSLSITLDGTTVVATATTDRFGNAVVSITIPSTTTAGVHRVVATGWDGTSNSATVFVLRR